MHVLAFDFGLRHIGVATGQQITATATPLTTLRARDGIPDFDEVAGLIAEWKPACLIVGLPLNMDDSDNPITLRARRFARRLHGRYGIRTELTDERLSSRAAQDALGAGHEDSRTHAYAAKLIAETWLAENPA